MIRNRTYQRQSANGKFYGSVEIPKSETKHRTTLHCFLPHQTEKNNHRMRTIQQFLGDN